MSRTIFNTPCVTPLLRALAGLGLACSRWRLEGHLPSSAPQCVLIAAPYTSRWDWLLLMLLALRFRLNLRWLGDQAMFGGWLGGLMRWFGGIAVHPQVPSNMVSVSARLLKHGDSDVQLLVLPEGSVERVETWRTGFYWIARSARVPIVLAYLDYAEKLAGIGPVSHPSGDIEADMRLIKAYYKTMTPCDPARFTTD